MKKTTDLDESVEHLVEIHREHDRSTTPIQRAANQVTRILGQPATLALIVVLIVAWVSGSYLVPGFGASVFEEFPFPVLGLFSTVTALLVAVLILSTQRHQDLLAERRAQLTLQIALLSERKVAKIIELLEEQRRENPLLASRIDEEAEAMAQAIDPRDSIERLKRELR